MFPDGTIATQFMDPVQQQRDGSLLVIVFATFGAHVVPS